MLISAGTFLIKVCALWGLNLFSFFLLFSKLRSIRVLHVPKVKREKTITLIENQKQLSSTCEPRLPFVWGQSPYQDRVPVNVKTYLEDYWNGQRLTKAEIVFVGQQSILTNALFPVSTKKTFVFRGLLTSMPGQWKAEKLCMNWLCEAFPIQPMVM